MQQAYYNKINLIILGLVVFCTIIASLVLVFFLAPMMMYGGGPFGMGAPIPAFENMSQNFLEYCHAPNILFFTGGN